LVIDCGCPGGQLLQPSGQLFELLVCTEFVQAVNADLNRLGVAVDDTVEVLDVTHDRLRSNETGISERPGGHMAPKPKPARFVFTAGMALTILAVITSAVAALSESPIYQPQLLLLY
jgi:hypothetical protein